VLDVDGREAERLVLAGRPKLALTLVERVRGTAAALGESPRMMSKLARIAGAAHLALGRRTAAARCLREAIALAQSADAIYEEGLAWELLATAGNGDAEHAAAEAARILGGLGVVRYAPEPLATAPARR
jgi:hypothetical protein